MKKTWTSCCRIQREIGKDLMKLSVSYQSDFHNSCVSFRDIWKTWLIVKKNNNKETLLKHNGEICTHWQYVTKKMLPRPAWTPFGRFDSSTRAQIADRGDLLRSIRFSIGTLCFYYCGHNMSDSSCFSIQVSILICNELMQSWSEWKSSYEKATIKQLIWKNIFILI